LKTTTNPLKAWMDQASAAEKRALALAAGTSYQSLHQMAKAYRTDGKLRITPDMARKLEIASKYALRREELCPACGRCELASLARQEN
jgi:hypothetical protein